MREKLIGAILLILLFVALGFGVKFIAPLLQEKHQRVTSDAQKVTGTIRLALDDWIGYFPLRSPEFKSRLRKEGWSIKIDNNSDIGRRMKMMAGGQLDFCVFDVSSDVLKGKDFNYPAVIIGVIDESKGGDSIWARADKVPNLDALKGNSNLRIAFTPDSPSHHLLKATSFHFAVPEIIPAPGESRRLEVNGASEALKMLVTGAADVAVLWEPYGSKARALSDKGLIKLLGSEDTDKLIVDVFLVSREFAKNNPEATQMTLSLYFQVLKYYRDNPDQLTKHVREETSLSEAEVQNMLAGVFWPNLRENCEQWFGISAPGIKADEGLAETIESTVKILINTKDFSDNPLPNGDPYRLTQSKFLQDLYVQGIPAVIPDGAFAKAINTLEAKFSPLDDAGWKRLREIGTLKIEPIVFQSWSSDLDYHAKQVVDDAADNLKRYPNFRLRIEGHTSTQGDAQENLLLSQERAEAVSRYLQVVYNIDSNRLKAVGRGGENPLARLPNESKRAWEYRLPRVELVLLREDY